MLALGSLGGTVRFAFTSRAGGFSTYPYDSLNLSSDVGDDSAAVASNRNALLKRLRVERAVWLHATHGANVALVTEADAETAARRVDGLVTRAAGLALGALAADCALVVLADPTLGVVGVLHCGRVGLVAGIVAAGVAAMASEGAREVVAAIGPTICGNCYVVPAAMAAEVVAAVPAAASSARPDALDIRAGVAAQLTAAGVRVSRLVGGCTLEDPSVFSYRRNPITGRHAALVWRTP